jgi:hypothetical protein
MFADRALQSDKLVRIFCFSHRDLVPANSTEKPVFLQPQ